ncbi:hypothetical protein C0J52_19847 [Blattella germanica]|nr:hypothetical protein C0J52_19847 [Blattella germanica]
MSLSIRTQKKHIIKNRKTSISRKHNIPEINKETERVSEAEKATKQKNLNLALTLINKVINSGIIHQQNNRKAQPWLDKKFLCKKTDYTAGTTHSKIIKATRRPVSVRGRGVGKPP